MFLFWIFLTAVNLAEAFTTLLKNFRFHRFFLRELNRVQTPSRELKVALLAPCKGVDSGLRENVQSWTVLNYSNYKIFFIVESKSDPALPILKEFSNANLLVAGRAQDCGQKIHNLRYAIENIPEDFEVFAFVDSDCRLKPDWLSQLVSRLITEPEGAVTGYRWFVSDQYHLGSQMRAVWNSSVLTLLNENGKGNFAWGGSMAILRQTFFSACVFDHWKGSISDDYGLTRAIRAAGHTIHFVPGALTLTGDSISLRDFFSWATRQLLITRIYHPSLWTMAFLHHIVWFLWVIIGAFYLQWFVPLFLITQLAQLAKAEIRLDCARRVFPNEKPGKRLYFWFLSPVLAVANFFMLVGTLFTRTVRWRSVEYRLKGPNQMAVRHL